VLPIVVGPLLHAVALCDESPLENYPAFLISLILFSGKFIHPPQFGFTRLARNIPHLQETKSIV
jgi:hypothetical protein